MCVPLLYSIASDYRLSKFNLQWNCDFDHKTEECKPTYKWFPYVSHPLRKRFANIIILSITCQCQYQYSLFMYIFCNHGSTLTSTAGYNFRYPTYYYDASGVYSRDLLKVNGIRFIVLIAGEGRKFDIISLVLNISYVFVRSTFADVTNSLLDLVSHFLE